MSSPSVCAVCLTADRPELTARAVKCFLEQRYEPKSLLLFDSGHSPYRADSRHATVGYTYYKRNGRDTIGLLRNLANGQVQADIIMHWDSDDWSHPYRMGEQVAELEASRVDVVGYGKLLFWDSRPLQMGVNAEAWMYDNAGRGHWMPGTTLCYWKNAWRRREFPERKVVAEDSEWLQHISTKAGCFYGTACEANPVPRMIAHLHGGNTAKVDPADLVKQGATQWRRMPEWDGFCRERMTACNGTQ